MSRHRRPSKLTRLLADAARDEADRAAIRGAAPEPAARPGRQCRDCGNRAGSAACVKACGGAR